MRYSYYNPLDNSYRNPWLLFLSMLMIAFAGLLFIGPVLGFLLVLMLEGTGLMAYVDLMTNVTSYPEHRSLILGVQGVNSIGAFIIAPLLYQYTVVSAPLRTFFPPHSVNFQTIFLTALIIFSFMVINSLVAEWNADFKFPEALSGFESWARGMEDQLKVVTEFLTDFHSFGYFLLSVIVIAVIPAIGEELLFRGLLQNIFRKLIGNVHIAIWLASFLFGVLHFQFYGLIPRILLGGLFGYLYLWSGNLLVPIVGHFINNGVSLLLLFLYQEGLSEIDVESTESFPLSYIMIFSVLFVFALFYFRKQNHNTGIDHGLGNSV